MENFIDFVIKHWELWLALVIIIGLIIRHEFKTQVRGVHLYNPQQLTFLMNQQQARCIDVRESVDYARGHILGAVLVPKASFVEDILKKFSDKTLPIVICAPHNQTAIQLGIKLRQQGYEHVGILKGGIHAWLAQNLPLAKSS